MAETRVACSRNMCGLLYMLPYYKYGLDDAHTLFAPTMACGKGDDVTPCCNDWPLRSLRCIQFADERRVLLVRLFKEDVNMRRRQWQQFEA